jgi:hypothetical protein
MTLPKPPKVPCGSCPYRKDVPSGIWSADEYVKLPKYDGDVIHQLVAGAGGLFMCHQKDGCICGGWLVTHGPDNLAALRIKEVDPSVWDYDPGVECFTSGAEAALHGMADIENPSEDAFIKMGGIEKLRESRDHENH